MRDFDKKSDWSGETVSFSSLKFLKDALHADKGDPAECIPQLSDGELRALGEYLSNYAARRAMEREIGGELVDKAMRVINSEYAKRGMNSVVTEGAPSPSSEEPVVVPRDLDRDDTPPGEENEE